MRDQSSRVFVVTGAASGIGQATAEQLVAGGDSVVLLDRDADRLRSISRTLDADRALARPVDVADEVQVAEAIGAGLARFGRLDGVVTSAGLFDSGDLVPLEDLDLAVFDRVIATNLRGTVLTLRAVLPHLESGSAIVTVASTAGLRGHGFGAAYTASKGAIVALTRLLAVQYGPKGVRVNCVCPGATAGEGMGSVFLDAEAGGPLVRDVPLRRVGQAAELGATIVALLGDSTSYLTGQIIAVDGGATSR